MADQFLSKGNTDVFWEVLADDDSVPKTKETQETFVWLLPRFHAKHSKPGIDLMDLNKSFIREMITEVKKQTGNCSLALKQGDYTIVVTNGKESVKFEQKVK